MRIINKYINNYNDEYYQIYICKNKQIMIYTQPEKYLNLVLNYRDIYKFVYDISTFSVESQFKIYKIYLGQINVYYDLYKLNVNINLINYIYITYIINKLINKVKYKEYYLLTNEILHIQKGNAARLYKNAFYIMVQQKCATSPNKLRRYNL